MSEINAEMNKALSALEDAANRKARKALTDIVCDARADLEAMLTGLEAYRDRLARLTDCFDEASPPAPAAKKAAPPQKATSKKAAKAGAPAKAPSTPAAPAPEPLGEPEPTPSAGDDALPDWVVESPLPALEILDSITSASAWDVFRVMADGKAHHKSEIVYARGAGAPMKEATALQIVRQLANLARPYGWALHVDGLYYMLRYKEAGAT